MYGSSGSMFIFIFIIHEAKPERASDRALGLHDDEICVDCCSAPSVQKLDHFQIIKFPLTTESAMKKIEDNNTLVSHDTCAYFTSYQHDADMPLIYTWTIGYGLVASSCLTKSLPAATGCRQSCSSVHVNTAKRQGVCAAMQVFIVDVRSNKRQIKEAVARLYDIQTQKINTLIRCVQSPACYHSTHA